MAAVLLSDVKTFLNITSTTDDAELTLTLNAALTAIEKRVGPLTPVTVVEPIYEHGRVIVLRRWPVISVQTVTVAPYLGSAAQDDTAGWVLDPTTGVLRRMIIGGALGYYGPLSVLTVTYTAGRTDPPLDLVQAVLFMVGELWRSQRGFSPSPMARDQPMSPTHTNALTDRCLQLIGPYTMPGLA